MIPVHESRIAKAAAAPATAPIIALMLALEGDGGGDGVDTGGLQQNAL